MITKTVKISTKINNPNRLRLFNPPFSKRFCLKQYSSNSNSNSSKIIKISKISIKINNKMNKITRMYKDSSKFRNSQKFIGMIKKWGIRQSICAAFKTLLETSMLIEKIATKITKFSHNKTMKLLKKLMICLICSSSDMSRTASLIANWKWCQKTKLEIIRKKIFF